MDEILNRFIASTPVAVMVQATLRRIFADSTLNDLFERNAQSQYTRELTFSVVTKLMLQVTTKKRPSLYAAYQHAEQPLPVSLTSLYNKVNGLETGISQALVHETATAMQTIVAALPKPGKPAVAGLHVRTLDGNFLAGTDHRLDCLRGNGAAALPGMSLVVRDGKSGLLTNLIPCEDAYTSERSLFPEVLALAEPNDLWLADRNFCTLDYLAGLDEKQAYFVIRHHAGTKLEALGKMKPRGSNASGKIFEQRVRLSSEFECRCVIVQLLEPLRDGATELRVLTNVPTERLRAKRALDLYSSRWQIETAFQELTENLRCEIDTLGYPQAALFGFALAVTAYNILVVMRIALASARARTVAKKEEAQAMLSSYQMAHEVSATTAGMLIAVPESSWQWLVQMSLKEFAAWLVKTAAGARLERYRKSRSGRKNPTTVRRTQRGAHRSTARLLATKRHQ